MLYSDKATMILTVLKINPDLVTIDLTINTGIAGVPFDIVAVPFGFVMLHRKSDTDATDKHTLTLTGMQEDKTVKFTKIIMNNGDLPIVANADQLMFKDSAGSVRFGLQVDLINT